MEDKAIDLKNSGKKPDLISRVLWWCATAIPDIIKDCRSDANRAKIIGLGVLFTFLYATIAWLYFWSLTIRSPWIFIPLGLFMGFGILTIDRMLIASIKGGKINIVPTIFRVLLALALGAFIAQPVILWMFQDDLAGEIKILNDAKIAEKNASLLSIKDAQTQSLIDEKGQLDEVLASKYQDVQEARQSYQQEIDGTGGSMRYGIKAVGREKGRILEMLEAEYDQLQRETQPRLDTIAAQLSQIETNYVTQFEDFKNNYDNRGFLIQVEALQSLLERDETGALRERYWLLLAILVMFELIPIISKIFLPTGSYDHKVELRDEWEVRSSQSYFEKEVALTEKEDKSTREQDARLMDDYFDQSDPAKKKKSEETIKKWLAANGSDNGDLWERIRDNILNKR